MGSKYKNRCQHNDSKQINNDIREAVGLRLNHFPDDDSARSNDISYHWRSLSAPTTVSRLMSLCWKQSVFSASPDTGYVSVDPWSRQVNRMMIYVGDFHLSQRFQTERNDRARLMCLIVNDDVWTNGDLEINVRMFQALEQTVMYFIAKWGGPEVKIRMFPGPKARAVCLNVNKPFSVLGLGHCWREYFNKSRQHPLASWSSFRINNDVWTTGDSEVHSGMFWSPGVEAVCLIVDDNVWTNGPRS